MDTYSLFARKKPGKEPSTTWPTQNMTEKDIDKLSVINILPEGTEMDSNHTIL